MNLKRKLWWAQHRTDVYKYSTFILLFLVVTISIFCFTYSKFSSSNEMTMYETTVEPFIKNDYFIASYIDGEWSNEIPGKNDGYIVDKIVCDNNAVGVWDNDKWAITIENATKKIKCSTYFVKANIANQISALASTDTKNFATDDPDNNVRYIGKDPNNYVYFNCSDYSNQNEDNCEKWRIIGVFKNMKKEDGSQADLVKIIRGDSIGEIAWNNETEISNLSAKIDGKGKTIFLAGDPDSGSNYSNDWSKSSLSKILNSEYYNGAYSTGSLKNDSTRNAIESVTWNLGGVDSQSNLASTFYNMERSTNTYKNNSVLWNGKIGLMYPSDYGYATADGSLSRTECLSKDLWSWGGHNYGCDTNNYISSLCTDSYVWTLTTTTNYNGVFNVFSSSGIIERDPSNQYPVFPTLYLKSSIFILNGTGFEADPYQLSV